MFWLMNIKIIIFCFIIFPLEFFAQKNSIPKWVVDTLNSKGLNAKYNIVQYAEPSFLFGDFNGDKIEDIAVLISEIKTKKKGILILHGNSEDFFAIGAGNKFGKSGFDEFDHLEWLDGWSLCEEKLVFETKFDKDGGILGTIKRKLKNTGISIWENLEGSPLAGGIIYWDGKKYSWIHQGE